MIFNTCLYWCSLKMKKNTFFFIIVNIIHRWYLIWLPRFCSWCYYHASVRCATTTLLFVVLLPRFCSWCYNHASVRGATTTLLFVVLQPRFCSWCYYHASVRGATTTLLFVVLLPRFCSWCYNHASVRLFCALGELLVAFVILYYSTNYIESWHEIKLICV